MFSSGTTGNPKPIIFSQQDLDGLKQSIKRFLEIHNSKGTLYNLFPSAPHIAYNATRYYSEFSNSLTINTGGGKVIPTTSVLMLMKKIYPEIIAGTPDYIIHVLNEAKKQNINLNKVNTIIGANGFSKARTTPLLAIL